MNILPASATLMEYWMGNPIHLSDEAGILFLFFIAITLFVLWREDQKDY